jgi:hypothetical protein
MQRRLFWKEVLVLLGFVAPVGLLGGLALLWMERRFSWSAGTGRNILVGALIVSLLCVAYFLYRYARALGKEDKWD